MIFIVGGDVASLEAKEAKNVSDRLDLILMTRQRRGKGQSFLTSSWRRQCMSRRERSEAGEI